jgi:hypothetical protein
MNTHAFLKSNAHSNAPIQSKLLMTNHEFTGKKKKKKKKTNLEKRERGRKNSHCVLLPSFMDGEKAERSEVYL